MSSPQSLPLSKQIYYAIGQLGWATLMNIINLQLVYFYIPPESSGIPVFIEQFTFLVVLNAVTVIAASGRLLDAITDPLIASWSDGWKGKKGRRIPFMKFGAIPAALFCFLMFMPVVGGQSGWNIVWLVIVQALFYTALTTYVTPFFALLPELGRTQKMRLDMSTWISITYALGIILASQVPGIANFLESAYNLDVVTSLQYAIGGISLLAIVFMMVPTWTIDEKLYCSGEASTIPFREAIKKPFQNLNFKYYVVADFAYFTGLTITMTGLLYYITVLLGLPENLMGVLLPLMIIVSFFFYPLVNILAKKFGKKPLITVAFFWMGAVFALIYFMGNLPFGPEAQAYVFVFGMSLPVSFLGVLPNAVLADIAGHDAKITGVKQEGMFFAARTLMQKFGQTAGVVVFAILTTFGKDVGDDLGIRISGVIGAVLCILAGIYFMKYDEEKVLSEIE